MNMQSGTLCLSAQNTEMGGGGMGVMADVSDL